MPYNRPTLTQLRDEVLQDINAAQITDGATGAVIVAVLQKAILRVLAYAQAGLSYEHYAYLDWIAQQAVPWTATGEFLDGWAALKGVYREAAVKTTGTVTFAASGANLPVAAGASLLRSSDGAAFTVTAGAVSGATSITVSVQAVTAGAAANFDTGTQFTLQSPVAGITSTSSGSTQTTAGADQETDSALRTRMLQAYASPPQGGALADYVEWAGQVAGVTRVWIAPQGMGDGTVNVFFMMDEAEAAHNGFPQGTNGVAAAETRATAATGDQLAVANWIYPLRPVTALVYATAPTPQAIDFTITKLGAANTSTNQTAITAALTDMFLRLGNVGGTVDPATGDAWPAIEPNDWYAAVNAVPGLTTFDITGPTGPITANNGALPVLGTITFSS